MLKDMNMQVILLCSTEICRRMDRWCTVTLRYLIPNKTETDSQYEEQTFIILYLQRTAV